MGSPQELYACDTRYASAISIRGVVYVLDNIVCRNEVEFLPEILAQLQQVRWRRLDLNITPPSHLGKLKLHDWPIGKSQCIESRFQEFVNLLVSILAVDHGS